MFLPKVVKSKQNLNYLSFNIWVGSIGERVERFPTHKRANMPMYSKQLSFRRQPRCHFKRKIHSDYCTERLFVQRSPTTDHFYMYPCMYLNLMALGSTKTPLTRICSSSHRSKWHNKTYHLGWRFNREWKFSQWLGKILFILFEFLWFL